jgi:hypothetical protein
MALGCCTTGAPHAVFAGGRHVAYAAAPAAGIERMPPTAAIKVSSRIAMPSGLATRTSEQCRMKWTTRRPRRRAAQPISISSEDCRANRFNCSATRTCRSMTLPVGDRGGPASPSDVKYRNLSREREWRPAHYARAREKERTKKWERARYWSGQKPIGRGSQERPEERMQLSSSRIPRKRR